MQHFLRMRAVLQRLLLVLAWPIACAEPTQLYRQGEADGLRLEMMPSRPDLPIGTDLTVEVRLVNTTADSVAFDFTTSCSLLLSLYDSADHAVMPDRRAAPCGDIIVPSGLAPHGVLTVAYDFHGGAPMPANLTGRPLRAGTYRAFAEVAWNTGQYEMRSGPLTIRVH